MSKNRRRGSATRNKMSRQRSLRGKEMVRRNDEEKMVRRNDVKGMSRRRSLQGKEIADGELTSVLL